METEYLDFFFMEFKEVEKFLVDKDLLNHNLGAQIQELGDNLKEFQNISLELQKNIEKLEGINFDFSLNKELWNGVYKDEIKIDGFKTIPLMILLRKIYNILIERSNNVPIVEDHLIINLNQGEFNLILGTFSVNNIDVFNQRIKQYESSEIGLDIELKKNENENISQLVLGRDFYSKHFSFISKIKNKEEDGLYSISKKEVHDCIENINNGIEDIQQQITKIFQKIDSEFEELEESRVLKRSQIKNILQKTESEFEEYQELEEYYLNSKNEIQFFQNNIESSPETKFIFKFINELSSIEKKYDITQLRKKLNVNIPTIRENLARLGFNIYTDEQLGKDYIEITDKNLKWYISHFPAQAEKLIHTLSLRKYKDCIKYLGTKRLAQLIKNGYFYFDQLEHRDNKEISKNTAIPLGWIKKIKKYLPSARNKIKKNKC